MLIFKYAEDSYSLIISLAYKIFAIFAFSLQSSKLLIRISSLPPSHFPLIKCAALFILDLLNCSFQVFFVLQTVIHCAEKVISGTGQCVNSYKRDRQHNKKL